jgi:hypothetical protein
MGNQLYRGGLGLRWTTSSIWLAFAALAFLFATPPAFAEKICEYDPGLGDIICKESGGSRVRNPPRTPPSNSPPAKTPRAPLRYVYTGYDAAIGDCYYWSGVPGGLDAWDPANDPAVIAITTKLPTCPSTPATVSDPSQSAWSVFRSWNLAPPEPSLTPRDRGITGIPTHMIAAPPDVISHSETLPDGRTLEVKARAAILTIDWGDGTTASFDPEGADGYPDGSATHVYDLKTCSQQYRADHPSGDLCNRIGDDYTITASYTWQGEFNVGSGWIVLGSLDRAAPGISYDVDEARGVSRP